MIKLQAIGTLGKDAVVNSAGNRPVINFSIAHSEKFTDKQGNKQEKTTWIECAKWGEKTGIAAYLKKGGKVYVEGTPEVHTYQKQDGTTGTSLRLNVIAIELLGGNNGTNEQQSAEPITQPTLAVHPQDDLPWD